MAARTQASKQQQRAPPSHLTRPSPAYLYQELAVVKEDLSLSGLNFRVLRRKLLNRSAFFAAVAVLQCFAAFPVRRTPQAAHVWTFDRALQRNATLLISSSKSSLPACPVYEGWQWPSCSDIDHTCVF